MRAPLPYMVCCFLFKVENIKAKKYGKSQRKLNPPTTARRVSCETCCPAVLLVLYCCTSLCCICTTVIVNRGQGLRTPTPNPHQRPILVYPTQFHSIRKHTKENDHHPVRFQAPEAPEPAFGLGHSSLLKRVPHAWARA